MLRVALYGRLIRFAAFYYPLSGRSLTTNMQAEILEENVHIGLEDLQGLYLLALLNTCYSPNRRPKTSDFRRLVDIARSGGYLTKFRILWRCTLSSWKNGHVKNQEEGMSNIKQNMSSAEH